MSVNAEATITLKIKCGSTWNDNTTIDQVRKQAEKDAMDLLNRFGKIGNSVCSKDRNKRVEEEKRKADAEQKAKEVAARKKKKAQDFKKTIIS